MIFVYPPFTSVVIFVFVCLWFYFFFIVDKAVVNNSFIAHEESEIWAVGVLVTHVIVRAQGAVRWADVFHKFSLASLKANGSLSAVSSAKALQLRWSETV